MKMAIETIVRKLSAIDLDNVFNPYADFCGLHDRRDAPVQRRRNLVLTLNAAFDLRAGPDR